MKMARTVLMFVCELASTRLYVEQLRNQICCTLTTTLTLACVLESILVS